MSPGALGLAWVVAWWWLYDNPEKHRHLSAAERDYIQSGQPQDGGKAGGDPLDLPAPLPGGVGLLDRRHPGFAGLDHLHVLPARFSGQTLSHPAGGDWLVDGLVLLYRRVWRRGGRVARGEAPRPGLEHQRRAQDVACSICAVSVVPVFLAPYVPNIWLTVIIVGIAGSAHQGWSANLFSFVSDTMPKNAVGVVVGLGGFVGYFASGFLAELIGYLLKTQGNYVTVFAGASFMYLISLAILHLLVPQIGASKTP